MIAIEESPFRKVKVIKWQVLIVEAKIVYKLEDNKKGN